LLLSLGLLWLQATRPPAYCVHEAVGEEPSHTPVCGDGDHVPFGQANELIRNTSAKAELAPKKMTKPAEKFSKWATHPAERKGPANNIIDPPSIRARGFLFEALHATRST
jgi:hypothetical protein